MSAKEQLILQTRMHDIITRTNESGRERVHLAFDIICIDATKRMRNLGTMMKLPEAKNALGVDAEQY